MIHLSHVLSHPFHLLALTFHRYLRYLSRTVVTDTWPHHVPKRSHARICSFVHVSQLCIAVQRERVAVQPGCARVERRGGPVSWNRRGSDRSTHLPSRLHRVSLHAGIYRLHWHPSPCPSTYLYLCLDLSFTVCLCISRPPPPLFFALLLSFLLLLLLFVLSPSCRRVCPAYALIQWLAHEPVRYNQNDHVRSSPCVLSFAHYNR
jgi:hypothetical protein